MQVRIILTYANKHVMMTLIAWVTITNVTPKIARLRVKFQHQIVCRCTDQAIQEVVRKRQMLVSNNSGAL
jgi:hypothetical protein